MQKLAKIIPIKKKQNKQGHKYNFLTISLRNLSNVFVEWRKNDIFIERFLTEEGTPVKCQQED